MHRGTGVIMPNLHTPISAPLKPQRFMPVNALTCGVILSCLAYLAAEATTIQLQPLDLMTRRADAIVRAVPLGEPAVVGWEKNHRFITTRTKFRVLESFLGDLVVNGDFTVEVLGGKIAAEDVEMRVPASPVFREAEEVVLFLSWNAEANAFRTLDLAAGKFEIESRNGQHVVTRRDLGSVDVANADEVRMPSDWDAFRREVTACVEARKETEKKLAEKQAVEQKASQSKNAKDGGQ